MSVKEAHIAGIGTALPYPVSTERLLEKDEEIRRLYNQPEIVINQMKSFILGTRIHTRHYSHPYWLPPDKTTDDYPEAKEVALTKDIFTPNNFIPPYWERMSVFHETAIKMGKKAARKALEDWGGDPKTISHVFTTCTSGWSEPGLAVAVIQDLELPHNCQKAELNFNGCFCGATCLRLARDSIRAGDAAAVLVVAVEAASTHFDIRDTEISSLVAHALFADGAAAVVLSPEERGWRYARTGMTLVPGTVDLLCLNPPLQPEHSSYRMILSKDVGIRLGEYFREGAGKELLQKICPASSFPKPALSIHPGGPNILGSVNEVLLDMGWPDDAIKPSYNTLRSVGNLGAAAMLFVLAQTVRQAEEEDMLAMTFGPGVTVEWATLRKVKNIRSRNSATNLRRDSL